MTCESLRDDINPRRVIDLRAEAAATTKRRDNNADEDDEMIWWVLSVHKSPLREFHYCSSNAMLVVTVRADDDTEMSWNVIKTIRVLYEVDKLRYCQFSNDHNVFCTSCIRRQPSTLRTSDSHVLLSQILHVYSNYSVHVHQRELVIIPASFVASTSFLSIVFVLFLEPCYKLHEN